MVLYQFDFTVVAFVFEHFFLLDLFWIDLLGTLQEGEIEGKLIDCTY